MVDQPNEGGGLDSDIIDINKNYINDINYNPKLVEVIDVNGFTVEDMRTTGHYLTLEYPCDNKKIAVIPLPICILNG